MDALPFAPFVPDSLPQFEAISEPVQPFHEGVQAAAMSRTRITQDCEDFWKMNEGSARARPVRGGDSEMGHSQCLNG
jgi:hypothetical protein